VRIRDRHYELCTTRRGGGDLEGWPQGFEEKEEGDQGLFGEEWDRAFLTRLDAQGMTFGSVAEIANIRFGEAHSTIHEAKRDDHPRGRMMVASSLISRKMPVETDSDVRESEERPTKPSGTRTLRPSGEA